jgi:hypothetical protein
MFITQEESEKRLNSSINLNNILNPEDKNIPAPESIEHAQTEKDDLDKVLEGVVINRGEVEHTGVKGKLAGDQNVPTIFRNIIAAQAAAGESNKSLREAWGVSQSTVSNYKHGIPNRANPEAQSNKEVKDIVSKITGRIREKVCDRIELVLDQISAENISEETNLKTLSMIAANLSRTMQNMEPKKESDSKIDNRIQTIIYAPQTAEIEEYKTLEVAR